jgi:hypothetical protein
MATSFPSLASGGFTSTDPELAAVDASVRVARHRLFPQRGSLDGRRHVLLVYASSLTHPQDSCPILGLFVDLSNNFSFFTYGRVWPAAIDALVYGWATTAGLGLAVWLLARTSRTPMRAPGALMCAVVFWNLGVAIGLTGIFLGDSTSVELLEFPRLRHLDALARLRAFRPVGHGGHLSGTAPGHDHLAQAGCSSALSPFPWLLAGEPASC